MVTQVIVVSNDDTSDSNGTETESIGVAFCQKLLGADTNWKQTSYNGNMRGNYAGIGYTYMSNVATLGVGSTDIFISQQPYASWTVGVSTAQWYSPLGDAPALTDDQIAAGSYYVGTSQHIKQIIRRDGHLPLLNNYREGLRPSFFIGINN